MAITIRQVKVLNSVNENFEMAMQSPENKAAYLQQFESIVRGVEVSVCYAYCINKRFHIYTLCTAIINETRVDASTKNLSSGRA